MEKRIAEIAMRETEKNFNSDQNVVTGVEKKIKDIVNEKLQE